MRISIYICTIDTNIMGERRGALLVPVTLVPFSEVPAYRQRKKYSEYTCFITATKRQILQIICHLYVQPTCENRNLRRTTRVSFIRMNIYGYFVFHHVTHNRRHCYASATICVLCLRTPNSTARRHNSHFSFVHSLNQARINHGIFA